MCLFTPKILASVYKCDEFSTKEAWKDERTPLL